MSFILPSSFVLTEYGFSYYKESHKILGNTYGMCVLQDFEAITPNLLARTIETVEGGGLVVLLLKTMTSLKQLYTMTMVCLHCSPLFCQVIYWTFVNLGCPRTVPNFLTQLCSRPIQRAFHSLPWFMSRLSSARRRAQRTPYFSWKKHHTY